VRQTHSLEHAQIKEPFSPLLPKLRRNPSPPEVDGPAEVLWRTKREHWSVMRLEKGERWSVVRLQNGERWSVMKLEN
jgi:hypothetical protein